MMLGSMLLLSLYLQGVLGMSALAAGAGLLAARGTGIVWTAAAARVANRIGARAVLLTGMAAMTTGLLVLARAPADGSYAVDVLPGLLILGVAIPSLFLSVGLVAFEGARERRRGRRVRPAHDVAVGRRRARRRGGLGRRIGASRRRRHPRGLPPLQRARPDRRDPGRCARLRVVAPARARARRRQRGQRILRAAHQRRAALAARDFDRAPQADLRPRRNRRCA